MAEEIGAAIADWAFDQGLSTLGAYATFYGAQAIEIAAAAAPIYDVPGLSRPNPSEQHPEVA